MDYEFLEGRYLFFLEPSQVLGIQWRLVCNHMVCATRAGMHWDRLEEEAERQWSGPIVKMKRTSVDREKENAY